MNKRQGRKRAPRRRSGRLLICIDVLLLLVLAAIVALVVFINHSDGQDAEEEPSQEESLEMPEPTEISPSEQETVSSGDAEIVYEAPEYDFQLDEITVEIEGLTQEYEIAFVNDLHMITDKEPGDVLEEHMPQVQERYETLSVTSEGIHAEELWPEVVKFLNYHDFDAVIFGGDMLDYCSNSNMAALQEGFDALKYPREKLLYVRSDHDYSGAYGGGVYTDTDGFIAHTKLWDGDADGKYIEFDDFVIVGINKSYQKVSDDRLKFLKEKLEADKPVIVVTHVPFYSEEDEGLEELSMQVRNKIYYWNPKNSGYIPDENTQTFIGEMYAEDSNVVQILAAHLHAAWDGVVSGELKQHIFAPTFEGSIGIVHIVGKSGSEEAD